MNALGLIEVNGYLAAVEAADAALKAANVKLVGLEVVKAGITAVQLTGDVGAVKASVDAGRVAAEKLGQLRTAHVIPRLHDEVAKLLPAMNNNKSSLIIQEKEDEEELLIHSPNNSDPNVEEKVDKEIEEGIEKIENLSEKLENEATSNIEDEELKDGIHQIAVEMTDDAESNARNNILSSSRLPSNEDINAMRVDELRSLVRKLNIPTMTNKQIKFARKDELIDILEKYSKEGEK